MLAPACSVPPALPRASTPASAPRSPTRSDCDHCAAGVRPGGDPAHLLAPLLPGDASQVPLPPRGPRRRAPHRQQVRRPPVQAGWRCSAAAGGGPRGVPAASWLRSATPLGLTRGPLPAAATSWRRCWPLCWPPASRSRAPTPACGATWTSSSGGGLGLGLGTGKGAGRRSGQGGASQWSSSRVRLALFPGQQPGPSDRCIASPLQPAAWALHQPTAHCPPRRLQVHG